MKPIAADVSGVMANYVCPMGVVKPEGTSTDVYLYYHQSL